MFLRADARQITPAQEFLDLYFTRQPLYTCVGAIALVVAVALAFLLYDLASSRHLRKLTIAACEQYSSRMEEQWSMASKLAMSDLISSEITGPTGCIVGGLRELGASDLSRKQREVVVRAPAATPQRAAASQHGPQCLRLCNPLISSLCSAARGSWETAFSVVSPARLSLLAPCRPHARRMQCAPARPSSSL